jgi:hypothetical protein
MKKIGFRSSGVMLSVIPVAGFAIVGLLFALTDLIEYGQLGKNFTPFSVAYSVSELTYDETQVYVPGPRRLFETNSLKPEVDIFELRGAMSAWPLAHSLIIGSIAKLVGSLEVSWIIAHAIFPAIVWLLVFFCSRELQLSATAALVLATATCLIPFGLRNFFLIGQNALVQPLELSRMPHPGLSFSLVLLGIIAVSRAVAAESFIAAVGAGILIGLNFYSYYFYWITIALGFTAWLGAATVLRRTNDVKVLCIIGLTAGLTGLPFLVTLAVARSQGFTNLMERFGFFHRELSLASLLLALSITSIAVLLYARKKLPPLATAFVFVLAGGALGLNAHVLTGYDAKDYQHLTSMLIQPLAFFLVGVAILRSLPRPWYPPWLCVLATLMLVTLGAYRQVRVAHNVVSGHDRRQGPVQLVETLRNRIAAGSVVGSTDPQVLTLVPSLSTLWTFVPLGSRSQASNDEILRRFLILRKLEGATISDVHADFTRIYPSKRVDRSLIYVLFQNQLNGAQLQARIDELWAELNLEQDLSARRLNVLATIGAPPPLPEDTGWQLVKAGSIGKWNIFQLQSRRL